MERENGIVRAPGGRELDSVGRRVPARRVRAVRVHHPDLVVSLVRDPRAARGPGGVAFVQRIGREADRIRAVRADRPEVEIPVHAGRVRDPRPVRGPGRALVDGRIVRQAGDVRAVRVHDVDLVVAVHVRDERDPAGICRGDGDGDEQQGQQEGAGVHHNGAGFHGIHLDDGGINARYDNHCEEGRRDTRRRRAGRPHRAPA